MNAYEALNTKVLNFGVRSTFSDILFYYTELTERTGNARMRILRLFCQPVRGLTTINDKVFASTVLFFLAASPFRVRAPRSSFRRKPKRNSYNEKVAEESEQEPACFFPCKQRSKLYASQLVKRQPGPTDWLFSSVDVRRRNTRAVFAERRTMHRDAFLLKRNNRG